MRSRPHGRRRPFASGFVLFVALRALVADPLAADAQQLDPALWLDLYDAENAAADSYPSDFHALGASLWFTADVPGLGREAWIVPTAGSPPQLLVDLCPGECSSWPVAIGRLEDRLLVATYGPSEIAGDSRIETNALWTTDATAAGTERIAVFAAEETIGYFEPTGAERLPGGDLLFWLIADQGRRAELWRTDGTATGTRPVLTRANPTGSVSIRLRSLDGERFVLVQREALGVEIWRTDGTPTGTSLMAEIPLVYFEASSGEPLYLHGLAEDYSRQELWVFDGLGPPRRLLELLGEPERPLLILDSLQIGEALAFSVLVDPESGSREIWTSDGTSSGTRPRATVEWLDLGLGHASAVGSDLYYLANPSGPASVTALYRMAAEGTTPPVEVLAVRPSDDPLAPEAYRLFGLDGSLVFDLRRPETGREIARLAPATGGLELFDLCSGACDSEPTALELLDEGLLLAATVADGERPLFRIAGQGPAIRLTHVGELHDELLGGSPLPWQGTAAALAGDLYFPLATPEHGWEPWRAALDGSGDALVADLAIGPVGSEPWILHSSAEGMLFTALQPDDGLYPYSRLFWSDGTVEGTRVVPPDPQGWCPARSGGVATRDKRGLFWIYSAPIVADRLCYADSKSWREVRIGESFTTGVAVGAHEYFFVDDASYQVERTAVVSSDGTAAGTVERFDLPAKFESARLFGGDERKLYFERRTPTGFEVWSVGHDGETLRRIDEHPDPGARIVAFEPLAGRSLWLLRRSDGGRSLWSSDGTRVGTRRLAQLDRLEESAVELDPIAFVPWEEGLVFAISTADGLGFELWWTDGTAGGTWRGAVGKGAERLSPGRLQPTPAGLFFRVESPGSLELWRSDGSQAGTWALASAGQGRTYAWWWGEGAWLRDRFVFEGWSAETGAELWETFGTPATTRPIAEIRPGADSSFPRGLSRLGDRLVFVADDGLHGGELWAIEAATALGCPSSDELLCTANDRYRWLAGWRDFAGNQGLARARVLTDRSGLFWFFHPDNLELALKALDGSAVNERIWVFLGALTNVEHSTTVIDVATETGRTYRNPAGRYASFGDVEALPAASHSSPDLDAPAPAEGLADGATSAASGACVASDTRLCLLGQRFAVEATWRDFEGATGIASALPLTADTGAFWFFGPENVELLFKVVDGRALNGRFWIYFGALSNVEYTIEVTDTETGATRVYFNPAGQFASVGDVDAF